MGGGGGDTQTTIRYAPYLEYMHQEALNLVNWASDDLTRNWLFDNRGSTTLDDPYKSYIDLDIDDSFFGTGLLMTSYTSLYEMFGTHMSGLNVETLYSDIFDDVINGSEVADLISQEAVSLSDDLDNEVIPRFEAGMRDINAVMSTSFVVGKAMLETARTKALAKFAAEVRTRMIPLVAERWKTQLEWHKQIVDTLANFMKFYFMARNEIDAYNREAYLKHLLWPFTVYRYRMEVLGVLQNAINQKNSAEGNSSARSALGGALSGAAAGAEIGSAVPGIGTGIGAAVGGLIGLASGLV
jgi:hypothetical protein